MAHAAQDCEVWLFALPSVPRGLDVVHVCFVKFISQFSASWTFYFYMSLVVRQALLATRTLGLLHELSIFRSKFLAGHFSAIDRFDNLVF